jgi:hypothetical protein
MNPAQESPESLKVFLVRTKEFGLALIGVSFCCGEMQQRYEADVDTGTCASGKQTFNPTWKFKGLEISFCPFCGKPIEVDIKEQSDLILADGSIAQKLQEKGKNA